MKLKINVEKYERLGIKLRQEDMCYTLYSTEDNYIITVTNLIEKWFEKHKILAVSPKTEEGWEFINKLFNEI